jgi:hypothetical protein
MQTESGTTMRYRSAAVPAALAALYLAIAVAPAFAETEAEKEAAAQADAEERAKRAEQEKEDRAKAPPPAIPGAVSSGEAAPASKNAAEMSPNEALFDAINRGDAAGARDAMNRGAQLDSHNVLGQTPIDAAIEANRNDITFMLLSLRSSIAPGGPPHTTRVSATGILAPTHGRHASPTLHATSAVAHLVPAPANPGTPNPSVGFNGF